MKLRKPFRILRNLILFFFISSIGAVIFYRFVPVYVTPLMIIRSVQQLVSGEKVVCKHTWVPFDKISPSLPMAVIASEDNRFASHNGFDMIEIKKAMKENETCQTDPGTVCPDHSNFTKSNTIRLGTPLTLYQTTPRTNSATDESGSEVPSC